jgi:hypothetical protein
VADPAVQPFDDPLAEFTQVDMSTLHSAWVDMFGCQPPKGISRRLLEYAAAYRAQAKAQGGLKPNIRRKLIQAAPGPCSPAHRASRSGRPGGLSPGSRLVREWHGRNHTVEVAEGGFLYAGQRYRSLSEVARAITGARWSGPRFFGL